MRSIHTKIYRQITAKNKKYKGKKGYETKKKS